MFARRRPSSSTPRDCVVVLGMHRSGTSALAGTLSLLGVDFGSDLIGANSGNPRGHFELTSAVELDDILLRRTFGSRWKESFHLPANWRDKVDLQTLATARSLELPPGQPCGIKDPRMCRLVPVWLELLAIRNLRPRFIIALRPPAEVAASLETRDGLSKTLSQTLWLEHLATAERDTREYPRTFITMEALLGDTEAAVLRLTRFLDLPEPNSSQFQSLSEFLDTGLRHHNRSHSESVTSVNPLEDVHNLLTLVASETIPDDEIFRSQIDQLMRTVTAADSQCLSGPFADR